MSDLMAEKVVTDWKLSGEHINSVQQASIEELVRLSKLAHFVDIRVRINGEFRWLQADWLKWLEKTP